MSWSVAAKDWSVVVKALSGAQMVEHRGCSHVSDEAREGGYTKGPKSEEGLNTSDGDGLMRW